MQNSSQPQGTRPGRVRPRVPRWVKVLAWIGAVIVVLVVVLQFLGGGHGPGRHLPQGAAGADPIAQLVARA